MTLSPQRLKDLLEQAKKVEAPRARKMGRGRPSPRADLYAQVRPAILELLGKGMAPRDITAWIISQIEPEPTPPNSPTWWRWYNQVRAASRSRALPKAS